MKNLRYLANGKRIDEVIVEPEFLGGIDPKLLVHGEADNWAAKGGSNRIGIRKIKLDVLGGEEGAQCKIKISLERSVKAS
jgi:hypothetical protein